AQCVVAIDGPLDANALTKALQQVVSRHEILRSHFCRPAGMKLPLQVIDARRPVAVEHAECGDPDSLEALLQSERREVETTADAVLRARLAAGGANRHLLILTAPTMNADGLSLRLIVSELSGFYAGRGTGGEIAEQPLQYADFSEWQNESAANASSGAEAAQAFWTVQAPAHLPALSLPLQARTAPGAFEPGRVTVRIALETASRLMNAGAGLNADVEALLLGVWQVLLWRLTGREEFTVATQYDGRAHEEVQGAVGLYARP